MDPLSDILTLLNVRTAHFSRFEAGGEWALRFGGFEHVKIGALLAGSCWLTAEGSAPVRLTAGDCYLLAVGRPYEVADALETPAADGFEVYAAAGPGTVYYGTIPDSPDRTVMIGGSITFDDNTAALMLDSLPGLVRIAADSAPAQVLRPALRMLADETAVARPGTEVMTRHLTQILFIQALRAYLADDGADALPSWLGALNDPPIATALTLMHQQPDRRWTVADLASAVGMSRSSFALHFKTLVGLPPLDYLLRWRMRSAAQALRSGDRTVASVATEWGYASESAFSNAFKRVTGSSPARYWSKAPSLV